MSHPAIAFERPFRLAGWRVDPPANEIVRGGRTVRLEPKAMRLLACLAARGERPVTREALAAAIWPDVVVGDDSLSRLIFQLRRALGDDPRRPRFIETLPKVGYRLATAPRLPAARVAVRRRDAPVGGTTSGIPGAPGPSVLMAVAALGCAFSSGWWSARLVARRHRAPSGRPAAAHETR